MLPEKTIIKPIYRELHTDVETPISAYLKLRGKGPSFLLESVEGDERIARYSFIGVFPRAKYIMRNNQVSINENGVVRTVTLKPGSDPTNFLQSEMDRYHAQVTPDLPRFVGGMVGYMGYEAVRYFEPTLAPVMPGSPLPDAMYLLSDVILAFDNKRRNPLLIAHVIDGDEAAAERKMDEIEACLNAPIPEPPPRRAGLSETRPNMSQHDYEKMVRTAKEHIAAGDIFQVVLSQRFTRETSAEPLDIYRAVRDLNPSAYMFFFDFGGVDDEPLYLMGASPELLVQLDGRKAKIHPIAGTRPRGADPQSDKALEEELKSDPKERAEHVMLVDLSRNDVGRVCEYGSVRVPEKESFFVERYSHVMHLVSHVEGTLRPGLTAFDLVRAGFPAGTVSGAPKVRAMEIIAALEPDARGPYAGMVGYFGFDGAMDTCIVIRALVAHGKTVSVQAGAGVVADSDPTREYQETVNKAKAMMKAIDAAEALGNGR